MRLYLVILVIVSIFFTLCAGQQCGERGLRNFDQNLAKLLTIGNSGRKFPDSVGEPLKKWCNESLAYVNEIDKYRSKCLNDIAKRVVGVLVYSLRHTLLRNYCKKDKQKMADFAGAATCINNNDQVITKCYQKMIDGVLGAKAAEDKKKLPHVCCEYNKLFQCFDQKITKAPGCTEDHAKLAINLVQSVVGNAIDLACEEYSDGSDRCNSVGSPPKKKKGQRKWKSIAPPLLELLSSFDFNAESN